MNKNKKVVNPGRMSDKKGNKKIPLGRTLSTYDNFLGKKQSSRKKRPLVIIETNDRDELAVVALSSRDGKNRTKLKKYQQGQSYFKHFVEIEDDEGKPIKVNKKFRENHPRADVSASDISKIRDKVFKHSPVAYQNNKKIEKFRKK